MTQLDDGLRELGKIHGLANVTIGAESVTFQPVPVLGGRAQNDDRQKLRLLVATNLPQDLVSVDLRQLQIQQNQLRQRVAASVGGRREEIGKRLDAVTR